MISTIKFYIIRGLDGNDFSLAFALCCFFLKKKLVIGLKVAHLCLEVVIILNILEMSWQADIVDVLQCHCYCYGTSKPFNGWKIAFGS